MASFLIFYIIISFLLFGFVFAIISDVKDASITPIWTNLYSSTNDYSQADSLQGFDFLTLLWSFAIIMFVISVLWYGKQMAQKPLRPW